MMDDAYLLRGLDALSRAHETNYFTDGHRGAAIVAATLLCREVPLEAGAENPVRALIDGHWTHTPLCAPVLDEAPEPDGIQRIVDAIAAHLDGLRQAGHNLILPALALKAFRQLPEAVTPTRVDGLCKLVESFTLVDEIRLEESDEIPDWGAPEDVAEFVLSEWVRCIEAFDGRGQGWSGHLLTYARALLDLREMGYDALARQAEGGFNLYLKRIRLGPLETDVPRPEHPQSDLLPQQREYWAQRATKSVGIGHVFKYPYGFYGLMALARDARLKEQCMQVAYHVL